MATEFITARFPDQESAKVQNRKQMRDRVRRFIPEGVSARLRLQGEDYGPWRNQTGLVDCLLNQVDKMGVGPKLIVQRKNDLEALSIREVTRTPDLGAAPGIEAIHGAVWDKFDVRSGGLWYCRFIDGTHTVSKHGYQSSSWKGAAEDVFPNSGGAPALATIAEFVIRETKANRLKAATVIWLQRIWTPGSGERVYGGQTHYHVHIDVAGGSACKP